ncbi:hypothetical protein CBR_g38802 [Chara braunii]|uniref:Glycosyl hydrolase family 88 n=1 Tax=Chara braunii TaxID=69332 RepID=A0A388LQA1_CHABU|nr:hypothetical protein CBR_g38802 [Chara braunii]|eukprot:GBG84520.1 hypothetical protein CBR_g38802 [Chara braunii]
MADSQMSRSGTGLDWDYTTGLFAFSLLRLRSPSGISYARSMMDRLVSDDGSISGYDLSKYNLDMILPGRALLELISLSPSSPLNDKFRKAATLLRSQLSTQPRTSEGGFWHKQAYPYQMWLDGLYMAEPFYAQYEASFNSGSPDFSDIALQFQLISKYTYDSSSGLYFHGWDEKKVQTWANGQTGTSASIWGRAVGWLSMAVVDTLDYIPSSESGSRQVLLGILGTLAKGIARWQDPATGLWFQVVDEPARSPPNYLESSASSMFVYALAKGVNKNYLPSATYKPVAIKGFAGLVSNKVETKSDGSVSLTSICQVAGLGGSKNRDGTFDYYMGEPVVSDDLKGVGPFILAGPQVDLLVKR